jgi:hypothetical protein
MGLITPPQKNVLLQNHGRGKDPHRVVVPVKKKIFTSGSTRHTAVLYA